MQAALAIVLRDRAAGQVQAGHVVDPNSPIWTLGARRLNAVFTERLLLKDGARTLQVEVTHRPDGAFDVRATAGKEGVVAEASGVLGQLTANSGIQLEIDGHRTTAAVTADEDELHVFGQDGQRVTFEFVPPSFLDKSNAVSAGSVYTPMPCKISQVRVDLSHPSRERG